MRQTPHELLEKGLITREQFEKIELITSGRLVSVFAELRTLLYLGVLLFTTGMGILIYENIGDMGHLLAIMALSLLTIGCFWFAFLRVAPYTNGMMPPPTPYYDYVVLLGCLLFISVLGYLQFQYDLLYGRLGLSTLLTAVLFFIAGYRFDHLGVVSLAITALASLWSITLSPQKWYMGEITSEANLHTTAIFFGGAMGIAASLLDKYAIKPHFTFTYLNFSFLIFFSGAIAGLFVSDLFGWYVVLIYAGCLAAYYAAQWKKSFLFLLYVFLAGYIATTYLLIRISPNEAFELWFLYLIGSCGAFIYFILRYRNHFRRDT